MEEIREAEIVSNITNFELMYVMLKKTHKKKLKVRLAI